MERGCRHNKARRACTAIYSRSMSVRLSVRLSVTKFTATMRNKAVKKRYQQVRRYTGLILNVEIFVKMTAFKSDGVKQERESQYANKFELTADGFRALPISTRYDNYLMGNW